MIRKFFEKISEARWFARSTRQPRFPIRTGLAQTMCGTIIIASVMLLAACSASTSTATNVPTQIAASNTTSPTETPRPTQTSGPTQTSSPSDTPAVTSTPLNTAVPTSLDPCQLISNQVASTLVGHSFGPGTKETIPGGATTCTYGAQTTNVFTVEVVQAADVATANAAEAQFLADLQANLQQLTNEGLNVTQLPDFADGAVTAQASINVAGETFNGSAFGFRKGTIFFGFSYVAVGGAAPDSSAMQTEATTVLGQLP